MAVFRRPQPLTAVPLEDRLAPADLSGAEQYFLELINRARANPTAEAARYRIDLNEGLAAGTISAAATQPLAPNMQVTAAIDAHLAYLAGLGTLSHTGPNNSRPGDRVTAQGYTWTTVGENLAVSAGIGLDKAGADELHRLLFVDDGYPGRGHRVIMLRAGFEETGVGLTAASFAGFPGVYAGSDFAARDGNPFLTGVAYTDAVSADRFYTPGEGLGGVAVTASGPAGTFRTTTMASGGYSLQLPAGAYTVTFAAPGGQTNNSSVTVGAQNVKVDFVPGGAVASPPVASPPTVPAPPSAVLPSGGLPTRSVLVGADANGGSVVRAIDPNNGRTVAEIPSAGTTGSGARVASADVNGDGTPDVIIGTGPGVSTQVRVVDGKSGGDLFAIQPFEGSFRGGIYVAAGDLNGDGKADVVVTPDEGGGPRVAGFEGRSVAGGRPTKLFNDFFAFETGLRNGIYVSVGDVDGDGKGELIAGGGPGGGPRVTVFSGSGLMGNLRTVLADFFAGDTNGRGGVRVSADDLDGDGRADIVAGSGPTTPGGGGSRVTAYLTKSGKPGAAVAFGVDAFPGFDGGVFVG